MHKSNETYLSFDCETTGFTPNGSTLISYGAVLADMDLNVIDSIYDTCTIGDKRFVNNILGREVDLWPDAATKIHGITFEQQKKFQQPIDMYRKMWSFLNQTTGPLTMIYHANAAFDPKFLLYHSNIHAPKMYRCLTARLSTFRYTEDGEHENDVRSINTMSLSREYMKRGSDILKSNAKQQKIIDKMNDYLTKDRKTPVHPDKIREWMDKRSEAENVIALQEGSGIEFDGISLDKICKALGLKLDHHNALSDAEVLIPIYKFLKTNLS